MAHIQSGALAHTFLNFFFKVDIPILLSPGINNIFLISDQYNSSNEKSHEFLKWFHFMLAFFFIFPCPSCWKDYKCMRKCLAIQVELSFSNVFYVLNLMLISIWQNFGGSTFLILISLHFLAGGSNCSLQRTGAETVL